MAVKPEFSVKVKLNVHEFSSSGVAIMPSNAFDVQSSALALSENEIDRMTKINIKALYFKLKKMLDAWVLEFLSSWVLEFLSWLRLN